MALGFMNLLKQYKNWDIDRDIIVVDRPPMFSAETAKNYDYPVFCVNSEKGIYYQKKRGEYFDLVLVDRRGSSVVMKNTFVAATNQKGTCCIVRNEKENKKKRSAEGTDRHGSLCCYGAWGINSHRLVDEGQYFHAGPWICCGLK